MKKKKRKETTRTRKKRKKKKIGKGKRLPEKIFLGKKRRK